MKKYVFLAALLLVPSMAYFQKMRFESELQQELLAGIRADLEAEGVEGAEVRMDWLDATIEGVVADESVRVGVPLKVAARPGVRLAAGGNRLKVRGWQRVDRECGGWKAVGLLPNSFMLASRGGGAEGWDSGVRREEWVEAPIDAREWDEFLREYFEEPGNRWVELRAGTLSMGGEATLGLRADWLSMASGVVPKENVTGEFTIQRSIRHFAGYLPEGVTDWDRLRDLRAKLVAATVDFEAGTVAVSDAGKEKVADLAALILEAQAGIVFRIEGSPRGGEEEGEPLGMRRAKEVATLLHGYGVEEGRLEMEAVDEGGGDEVAHRVTIVLK